MLSCHSSEPQKAPLRAVSVVPPLPRAASQGRVSAHPVSQQAGAVTSLGGPEAGALHLPLPHSLLSTA